MTSRRLAKISLAAAVVMMVVSVGGFIVALVLNTFFLDKYNAYGEVPVPGTGSLYLPAGEVTVNSLHPATYMPTKMVLDEIGYSIDSLDQGVAATRKLVSDPALAQVTGKFFDRTREARANPQAYDAGARAQLWSRSLQLTGHADLA